MDASADPCAMALLVALPEILVIVGGAPNQSGLPATLKSISNQRGVSVKTVIAETAANVAAIGRSEIARGPSEHLCFLRSGDLLLLGALRALCDELAANRELGVVQAQSLPILPVDGITRAEARQYVALARSRVLEAPASDSGSTWTSIRSHDGCATPTLIRAEALGLWSAQPNASVEELLRTALRHVEPSWQAKRIPRVLAAVPRSLVPSRHTNWFYSLAQSARGTAVRCKQQAGRAVRRLESLASSVGVGHPYRLFAAIVRSWSFAGLRWRRSIHSMPHAPCVGYVLWRYPMLSQTFIRREVQGLRDGGLAVNVLALEPDEPPLPADPEAPAGEVHYFGPLRSELGKAFVVSCLRRQPWIVLQLWLYIIGHNHYGAKLWWRDRDVLYLAGQLASALAATRVTHVHAAWSDQYALVSFVAARLLGIPFTAQARAFELHRSVERVEIADRLRFAEFVVTNSHYNERHLQAVLGPHGPRLQVIYNGVELPRFQPTPINQRTTGPVRLLAVGRLVEQKGLSYLLRACRLLCDRGVAIRCQIIGGAAEPADTVTALELRMLHTTLRLESIVEFSGAQSFSNVLTALGHTDIFVLPCIRARDGSQDITPNSLIEAMAVGLPVVSTPIGAIPEIVDDGVNGLLVPSNDSISLANALQRLAADAALRKSFGMAARRKVAERFDSQRNCVNRGILFRSLVLQ